VLPDSVIDLPSKYLVYGIKPEDFKLRALKGKDEKLIASLTYENLESKFLEVLKNVITGMDPKELTLGDRLYIILWEAIHSYNKFCTLEYTCTQCMQKSEFEVDLSQIGVVDLEPTYKEPFPLSLTSGQTINMRLFRVKDEEKAVAYEKATGQSSWLYKYALSIVDPKMSDMDKTMFLEELPSIDVALIRTFHERFSHGPKMETVVECPKCGASEVAPVPFRIDLLFPYGKTLTRYYGNAVYPSFGRGAKQV
jgi:hypothetical protein